MTEKLYYQDSHLEEFEAQVISCQENQKNNCFEVVLDKTAFFPEGGGQSADSGEINGVLVKDVREKGGQVIHCMAQPLVVGGHVSGKINFPERFSKMQQHTGEHIVSGLVHKRFGYDNVGFHLGKESVTLDFNGTFHDGQIREIEWEANQAVAKNIAVQVLYPTKEELGRLDYRSKKELEGQVRIVQILGYDICACCAPHLAFTGEVGLIKLVDAVKYKGGTRVTMACGFRALQDYQMKEDNVREISRLLSAKPHETAEAVKRLQKEQQSMKDKMFRLQNRYLEAKLEELEKKSGVLQAPIASCLLFEEDLDKNVARRFVDAAMHRYEGICGIFLGNKSHGYHYILGSQNQDLRDFLKGFHQVFAGKGGGKPEMVQGTVEGGQAQLEKYFADLQEMQKNGS